MSKELSTGKSLPNNQPYELGECILDSLEKLGVVPVDIQIQILQEKDKNLLRAWYQLATKAKSVAQFIQEMQTSSPQVVLLVSILSE